MADRRRDGPLELSRETHEAFGFRNVDGVRIESGPVAGDESVELPLLLCKDGKARERLAWRREQVGIALADGQPDAKRVRPVRERHDDAVVGDQDRLEYWNG